MVGSNVGNLVGEEFGDSTVEVNYYSSAAIVEQNGMAVCGQVESARLVRAIQATLYQQRPHLMHYLTEKSLGRVYQSACINWENPC